MNAKAIMAAALTTVAIGAPIRALAVHVGMSTGATTTTVSVSPYRSMTSSSAIIGPGSITANVANAAASQQGGGTTPGGSGSGSTSSNNSEQEYITVLGGSIKSTTTIQGMSITNGTTFASSVFSNL